MSLSSYFLLQVMDRVFRTMGLHPKYLVAFQAVHDQIVSGEGPLEDTDRHYIALMVSHTKRNSREKIIFIFYVFCFQKSSVAYSSVQYCTVAYSSVAYSSVDTDRHYIALMVKVLKSVCFFLGGKKCPDS
jgi:hypothetical protein